jgi:NAD(P)-dependent dehydrogenase (short-subunit alcohol dehydrogenase family)
MMAVYSAMKAAVTNLTRTLSLELAPHGIRVNTVAPDVFPTPATIAKGWNSADGESPRERMREHIAVPLGRWGRREELANCVLFLASDLASYVTGTTLHVDGGTSASAGWFNWPDGYSMMPPAAVVDHLLGQPGSS